MAKPEGLDKNKAILLYKQTAVEMMQLAMPHLSLSEIEEAVNWSIMSRAKDHKAHIHNNYKNRTTNTTVYQIANYILSRQPIITSHGVMFAKHGEVPNPLYELINKFINERVMYKKEMFKYPKGSEMYEKYNLLQLLKKLDANALKKAL